MKYFASSAMLLVLASTSLGGRAQSPQAPPASPPVAASQAPASFKDEGLPDPYKAPVENWGTPLPDGRKLGATIGVSIDSKGNLWAVERCGTTRSCVGHDDVSPILEFDVKTGKLIKAFGAGMIVIPHDIFIDKNDHDAVWVVDQGLDGNRGQQVWKFSPEGKVLLTLGTAGKKGLGPDTFNEPCSVVVGKNGDIFVADGHGARNQTVARIVKFSKDGKYIKDFGKKGSAPGELDEPHAITMDAEGRVFVADRNNHRVSIFDQDGKFLEAWTQFGIPTGLEVDRSKDVLYVTDNFLRADSPYKRGVRFGSAKTGKVAGFIEYPSQDPKSNSLGPDAVAVEEDGTLFMGENDRQMISKFELKSKK